MDDILKTKLKSKQSSLGIHELLGLIINILNVNVLNLYCMYTYMLLYILFLLKIKQKDYVLCFIHRELEEYPFLP